MSPLAKRIISALVALLLLVGILYLGKTATYTMCVLVAGASIFEFANILFTPHKIGPITRFLFFVFGFALFLITLNDPTLLSQSLGFISLAPTIDALSVWGALSVVSMSCMLWISAQKRSNDEAIQLVGVTGLGILYCGLFPAFILRTLDLPSGESCFFTLLCIVFLGDSFAYFGGRWFGDRKLLPSISPKKTWAGSYAGILGSIFAALICGLFLLKSLPLWYLVLSSILVGAVAQCGDLFISLLKRVAQVKDSGQIMPGHGGFLDRLDGAFFAAPIYYIFIKLGYTLI